MLRLNPFDLSVDRRDSGLNTLCHSCGFYYQQTVLKMLTCKFVYIAYLLLATTQSL